MRPEKRLTALVFLLIGLLFVQLIGGCASASPSRVLVDSNEAYAAMLNSFADLKAVGVLNDADKARVAPFVALASSALDQMQASYNAGTASAASSPFNAALAIFKNAMLQLAAEQRAAQNKQKKGSVLYDPNRSPGGGFYGGARGFVLVRLTEEAHC